MVEKEQAEIVLTCQLIAVVNAMADIQKVLDDPSILNKHQRGLFDNIRNCWVKADGL